ncbi:MAG TPA: ABC transporter permease, partial [Candidatus Thermoplasmatota archaeon]
MQRLFEDLPRALRGLLRGPAFTLPAVLILAVAIGANTAIFTVVDAVVLRPLPLPDSRELVILCEEHASIEGYCIMSPPNAEDLGREARTLEGVGLVRDWPFAVGDAGESAAVRGGIATPAFFRLLGVELERGRAFAEDEVGPGRDRVVLLGHALWTTRFGADPSVVGSTVTVDGEPNTVVGVLPAGFEVPA